MCERSAIYCWSDVYTFGPYFIQRCVNIIFTIWRGVSNPTCRDWVYYDVTDGGRGRMSASVSELTSDALYIIKK